MIKFKNLYKMEEEVKNNEEKQVNTNNTETNNLSEKEMIEKAVDDIMGMYKEFGNSNYIGEKISQIEHALQCAVQAEEDKSEKELVIAALLHDIGHIIGQKHNLASMAEFGTKHHDLIGGKVLRKVGMCEKVCDLIENHVKAKRYLVTQDVEYYNNLSDASKETLRHQGGILTKEEMTDYEQNPRLELYIKMRKYDEKAKIENMKLPELSQYRDLMIQCFY